MKSNYICLNNETFEIENKKDMIVPYNLAKTISLLSKKGYLISECNNAQLYPPFLLSALVEGLIDENVFKINDTNKNKIRKIIEQNDYESISIIFEDDYKFEELPKGFVFEGRNLRYVLSIFKDANDIKFKTLVELDKERNESIKNLENWAEKLPYNN